MVVNENTCGTDCTLITAVGVIQERDIEHLHTTDHTGNKSIKHNRLQVRKGYVGTKKLVKRKEFEQYISERLII